MPEAAPLTLVTGGAKRIGAAIVMELAQHGHDVVIHYGASREEAEATADLVRALGREVWTLQADLSNPTSSDGLVAQAADLAGRPLDHVAHNASEFPHIPLDVMTAADLDRAVHIHAWAGITLTRALASQDGSSIVHLLDTRITSHDPQHVPYLLSKQTLASAVRMLAKALSPLRVNGVAPGPILEPTDGSDAPKADLQRGIDTTVLRRAGTPEEVAQAVRFMLEAEYVTGDVLFVDGGRHLRT